MRWGAGEDTRREITVNVPIYDEEHIFLAKFNTHYIIGTQCVTDDNPS